MNELKRGLPSAGNLLRGTRVIAACRGANPEDLSALFARTKAIQGLLHEEARTIDEVCDDSLLTVDKKLNMMNRSDDRIQRWRQEVEKIFSIAERLN